MKPAVGWCVLRGVLPHASGRTGTGTGTGTGTSTQAQAQAQDILSGLNILLAEDDSFLAQLTQKMLSAKGANVTVAENGQIALDAFQTYVMTQTFDMVITDLMMPELNGHGLVKADSCARHCRYRHRHWTRNRPAHGRGRNGCAV